MKDGVTGITIKNADGSVIDVDIVIPVIRGTIHVCHFIQDVELAATSNGVKTNININKAQVLLGHGSEDITRQTAL